MDLLLDSYERKARFYPGVLLLLPAVATGADLLGASFSLLETLGTVLVACGGAYLLAQLTRDAGLGAEKKLLGEWGAFPSVLILRHRDHRLDSITKARYHARLAVLMPEAKAPSATDERADPTSADRTYVAWSKYVKGRTRDGGKYPLILKENTNYGFRRNMLGLRPFGIAICIVCCLLEGKRLYSFYKDHPATLPSNVMLGAAAISFLLLILWVVRFSPRWVRVPAFAYADRLAESIDTL